MSYYKPYRSSRPARTTAEAKYTVLEALAAAIHLEQAQDAEKAPTILEVLGSVDTLPHEQARAMIEEVQQHLTMKMLRGAYVGASGFMAKVIELVNEPQTKINSNWGVISHIPKLHASLTNESRLFVDTADSRYQGEIGKHLQVGGTVRQCKYVAVYNFFVALVVDAQGNAYSFNPKSELTVGSEIQFRGKVKSHQPDRYNNNTATTYLNYVKIQN